MLRLITAFRSFKLRLLRRRLLKLQHESLELQPKVHKLVEKWHMVHRKQEDPSEDPMEEMRGAIDMALLFDPGRKLAETHHMKRRVCAALAISREFALHIPVWILGDTYPDLFPASVKDSPLVLHRLQHLSSYECKAPERFRESASHLLSEFSRSDTISDLPTMVEGFSFPTLTSTEIKAVVDFLT
jgi:hypothetical protein